MRLASRCRGHRAGFESRGHEAMSPSWWGDNRPTRRGLLHPSPVREAGAALSVSRAWRGDRPGRSDWVRRSPAAYTHLTLPTTYSV